MLHPKLSTALSNSISKNGERAEDAERIIDTTRQLVGIADRAREIQRMMDESETDDPTPLARVVDRAVRTDVPPTV